MAVEVRGDSSAIPGLLIEPGENKLDRWQMQALGVARSLSNSALGLLRFRFRVMITTLSPS